MTDERIRIEPSIVKLRAAGEVRLNVAQSAAGAAIRISTQGAGWTAPVPPRKKPQV